MTDLIEKKPTEPTNEELAAEETLSEMTVRFANKRQDIARWSYGLACSKAKQEYHDGTAQFLESVLGTLDAIPGTVKYDPPEDLEALQMALEIAVAVQEQVQENFYREIHEAEAELNWTLSKLAEETPEAEFNVETTVGEIEPIR